MHKIVWKHRSETNAETFCYSQMFSGAHEPNSYIFANGIMADAIRSYDWTSSLIGPLAGWPSPLLYSVNQILDSSFPMFIWWGEKRIQFYNDAYLEILGTDATSKHPKALGQSGEECWPEIWPVISPLLESVLQTTKPVYLEDQLIPIYRQGKLDDVYWTFSYNVIRETTGSPGGILVVCSETTGKVTFQKELAAVNEELAASNEELTVTNEELNYSQQKLQDLNSQLENRVAQRTEELQEAGNKVESHRQRLASVVKNVPAGLAILTGKNMVLDMANDYMLNLWDKDQSAIGKALLEFLPELSDQAFPGILDDVFTSSKPFFSKDAAVELNRAGQKDLVYMDFSYTPLMNSEGQTQNILVLAEDVTERTLSSQREQQLTEELSATNEELAAANEEMSATMEELARAQRQLEQNLSRLEISEARFQNLVRDATVGIIVLSGDEHRVLIVNDAYARLIGRKASDIFEQPLFRIIPEAEKDFKPIIDHVRESGQPVSLYDTPYVVYADGEKIEGYLDLVYQPYREQNGTITGTMILCQDVTERLTVQKDLKESEARFRFMLDAIPQQVWTAVPNGALEYVNQVVSGDFGQSGDDVVGHGWKEFVHPEDLPAALEKWLRALNTKREYHVEFRLKFADGNYYWHLARALPLIEDNQVKLWLGTNTNIHHQKEKEFKKDEFISIASHELKTPLTTIKAFFQLSKRELGTQKVLGQFVEKAERQLERLGRLIEDLLDVSKINAGKIAYNMEEFDFRQSLIDVVESMQRTTAGHSITLQTNCDISYHGDQHRIEQVVINLLNNAIKYSPGADRIQVTCELEHQNIIVSVQDFGIGIAEEHLKGLFDRFYRVDNSSARFQGLGLGLFISNEIVKRHGGSFWIESEPGKGSTFYFLLPLNGKQEFYNIATDQQTYYEGNFITIRYQPKGRYMDVNWIGYQNFDSVVKGCKIILDLMQKNECQLALNDNSHVKGNWSEASDWGGEVWFPAMARAGLKKFAWIYSPSTFSRIAADKSLPSEYDTVQVAFFDDKVQALAWLCK